MKKLLTIFLIFILYVFASELYAQFSIGLKSGLNFPKVVFENDNVQSGLGPYINRRISTNEGLVSEYFFSKTLAIQTEVVFSAKGYKYLQEFIEGYQKYYYIQTNIGGKLENKIDKLNSYYFMISPYLAYWLYGKRYQLDHKTGDLYPESKIEFSGEYDDGTKFEYNRWDAGIIVVAGIKHKFSSHNYFFFDVRNEFGMINNEKENIGGTFNRLINFNVGYLFKF